MNQPTGSMKNDAVCLTGARLVLVPYLQHHVPRYHEWMSRADLLEATCSEQQSLEEEFENQMSWMEAEDKMTFILLAPLSCAVKDVTERRKLVQEATRSETGLDIFGTPLSSSAIGSSPISNASNQNTSSAVKEEERSRGTITECDPLVMIGDCNLFRMPVHHTEEGEVEVSVMLAEPRFRGKGLAREAVGLLMAYAYDHLRRSSFVAKILASNEASRLLFEKGSLGFSAHKEVKAFDEIHYMKRLLPALNPDDGNPMVVAECQKTTATVGSPAADTSCNTRQPITTIDELKEAVGYGCQEYDTESWEVGRTMALSNESEKEFYCQIEAVVS